MKFNREKFFQQFREWHENLRKKPLNQAQTGALSFLLVNFEQSAHWNDIRHISYALATISIETAYTYLPIAEYGGEDYFNRRYGPHTRVGRKLGNTADGDGALFCGRGFVQLTGRRNYAFAAAKLRASFPARYENLFLIVTPDKAKNPQIAFDILTLGMFEGWFTSHRLSDYIRGKKCNYTGARRIINGQDKALLIAKYAAQFERILRASLITSSTDEPKAAAITAEPGAITSDKKPSEPTGIAPQVDQSDSAAAAAAATPPNPSAEKENDIYADAALLAANKPDLLARVGKPVAAAGAAVSALGWGWRIALILAVCVLVYFLTVHRKEIYAWLVKVIRQLRTA